MIPARIKQIASSTLLLGGVALICFMNIDKGAAIAYAATTCWMLANLLVWAVVMKMVLQPASEKPNMGVAAAAIAAKLGLLIGGIVLLRVLAPFNQMQVYGLVAGISSVLFVAFLKAAGAKISTWISSTQPKKNSEAAKV